MKREIKFDIIVSNSKFSTIEHKTLEEAIDSEDVLIRGNEIIPSRGVVIRQYIIWESPELIGEMNHKGTWCRKSKRPLFCQEGECDNCQIDEEYKRRTNG